MLRGLFLLFAFTACANDTASIRVFAAASLTDALVEIGEAYERSTNERVSFNFAASRVLARQIEQGAPADVFLSADERSMDRIGTVQRASVLSNTLVIIGEGMRSPRDLLGKKVALGDPATVPAGLYAREYLTRIGLWGVVAARVIPTENVRAALAAVKAGNADAAIVYKTDARGVPVAYEIADGPKISYPFALLSRSEKARDFFIYLRSKPALDVFARHGFLIQ